MYKSMLKLWPLKIRGMSKYQKDAVEERQIQERTIAMNE